MSEMNDGETEIKVAQKGIKKKQKLNETDGKNGSDDDNENGMDDNYEKMEQMMMIDDDKNGMDDENEKIMRTKWMKGTKG
ncbi:uncharacterized protein OCT59_028750 [Rhizophagus irregularis]|nr:hypothetical protein OCT59_028750 [Rhizophagus irregularis]GBC52619.1 hypothetical protein RIR_jg27482.t1 [Rhizophagus irregularis DAOM 181602=DAOM 197198]